MNYIQHASQHDGYDKSVNGHGFTENDTDQIFGFDARGFDTSSEDARTRRVDTPVKRQEVRKEVRNGCRDTYRAAPITERDTAIAIPMVAHMYGVMDVRNLQIDTENKFDGS